MSAALVLVCWAAGVQSPIHLTTVRQVLRQEADPGPLDFPDGAGKKTLSPEQCRVHYIEYVRKQEDGIGTKLWICGVCELANNCILEN